MEKKSSDATIALLAILSMLVIPCAWFIFWGFHPDKTEMRMFLDYWPFAIISTMIVFVACMTLRDAGRSSLNGKDDEDATT